jgi:hypothetical protein
LLPSTFPTTSSVIASFPDTLILFSVLSSICYFHVRHYPTCCWLASFLLVCLCAWRVTSFPSTRDSLAHRDHTPERRFGSLPPD